MSALGRFHLQYYLSAQAASPPRPFIWTDARIEVNGVNLSRFIHRVALAAMVEGVDTTHMGDRYRGRIGRLVDWTLSAQMYQDFTTADPSVFPMVGSTVAVRFRPTSGVITPTNPEYNGVALLTEYPPLDASIGEMAAAGMALKGSGVLVRSLS